MAYGSRPTTDNRPKWPSPSWSSTACSTSDARTPSASHNQGALTTPSAAFTASMQQRPTPPDHLGLVEAVDRLGQGVVIGIADAADRRFDASVGEPLGVFDGNILRPAVRMVDEAAAFGRTAVVERLLQGIHDKAGTGGARDPPADNPPGKRVNDEGDVDEALPGRDIR